MGRRVRWVVLALVGFVGGCSNNSPTAPTTPCCYVSETRFFSDVLSPAGTSTVFTFTTVATDDVAVTLASLSDSTGEPLQANVKVNLGTVSGASCSPTTASKVVASTLTATVTATALPAGTYCISVADVGELAAPTNFTVRVLTSAGNAPAGNSGYDLLPSTLARMGASIKTFNASETGAASLTLAAIENDVQIKMGVGVWDGSSCHLNTSVITGPGTDPQLTVGVDAGAYCVRVADIGNLTRQVTVTGTISRP